LLKRLASNIPSSANLYLVNVKGEETSFYQKQHRKTTNILFSGIKNVKKKSYVIVEDVISMKKEEEINLRNAVNYTVHHNQSKLFCVSHTITKTGIYSMVGLFNYIIFTGSPSNLPVIRTCLRYFKIENEIVNRWLSCIKKESKKNVGDWDPYYFFDCTKMIFCVARDLLNLQGLKILGTLNEASSDSDDDEYDDDDDDDDDGYARYETSLAVRTGARPVNSAGKIRGAEDGSKPVQNQKPTSGKKNFQSCQLQQRSLMLGWGQRQTTDPSVKKIERKKSMLREKKLELIKKKFSNFFSGHELQNQACAIFSLIVEKIDCNRVDSSDLSITFRSRGAEKRKKISLVDYVASLLVPKKPPSLDHLVLHNFITSQCVLPVSCIRNENFLSQKK